MSRLITVIAGIILLLLVVTLLAWTATSITHPDSPDPRNPPSYERLPAD